MVKQATERYGPRDYVIVHELLHFHAPNHGKLWKSLMRVHLGEYEMLEAELRNFSDFPGRGDVTG
jgi:predicted metal-dependent hydrolase